MRVVLCALAKNEHLYINDFVKHYLNLGVDTIYIYDNDELTSPSIKDYIDQECLDRVVIKNIRGFKRNKLQHEIYTGFYKKYARNYDWCIFCDIDEYLFGITNIKEFLSKDVFKKYEQIRIKWKLFGDDDLITRDMSKPVYEVFKNEVKETLDKSLTKKSCLERQGKAIVRCRINNVIVASCHYASRYKGENVLLSCLPSGKPCFSKIEIKEDYSNETVFFHHYMTKSLSEFINQKLNRNDAVFNKSLTLDYYWRINKKTKDKIDFLKDNNLLYN